MEALFQRSLGSLEALFSFTETFFAGQEIDPDELHALNLVLEELFTNMVKFNPAGPDAVVLEMERLNDTVRVRLADRTAEPFDVTVSRPVDVSAPAERRTPGGLGLFLVHKFVDSLDYAYSDGVSTITFMKRLGGEHAGD
jgi:anti-sigma regulatory factor (Ser/Thr protein kinase)